MQQFSRSRPTDLAVALPRLNRLDSYRRFSQWAPEPTRRMQLHTGEQVLAESRPSITRRREGAGSCPSGRGNLGRSSDLHEKWSKS